MTEPVWLASGSPRRRTLLEWAGIDVDVHPSDVDETWAPEVDPVTHARLLAAAKAALAPSDRVVVAADTVVHQDQRLFDKPKHRDEAFAHLRALAGTWHAVTTGVCIGRGDDQSVFSVTTAVRFRELSDDEIRRYLQTGEADDKAGAYGIQGRAGSFVGEIRGSWTNVVGLPMEEVLFTLEAYGVKP